MVRFYCDLSSHFRLQAVGPENYLHFNYKRPAAQEESPSSLLTSHGQLLRRPRGQARWALGPQRSPSSEEGTPWSWRFASSLLGLLPRTQRETSCSGQPAKSCRIFVTSLFSGWSQLRAGSACRDVQLASTEPHRGVNLFSVPFQISLSLQSWNLLPCLRRNV